ncbi:MAG: hypothetical protein KF795_06240 [Labilithrix sp.]|nr:hypothetical protein [Labilithrix sp.]
MPGPPFDLRSREVRILECAHCDEPVAAPALPRLSLRCGYCGAHDEREALVTRASGDDGPAYRSRAAGRSGRRLEVDLGGPVAGLPRRGRLAAARALYLERKRAFAAARDRDDDARTAEEFALLHVAAHVAAMQIAARDWLHARAILEATLEAVTVPVYRALVLARLARLAAMCDAPELGDKWLSLCPPNLRVAEVASDVAVASAMLARARGDHAATLAALGDPERADAMVGNARWFATALRADAYEKLGQSAAAMRAWRTGLGGVRNAAKVGSVAATYHLAAETRKRSARSALVGLVFLLVAIFALISAIRTIESDGDYFRWIAIAAGAVAVAFVARWWAGR